MTKSELIKELYKMKETNILLEKLIEASYGYDAAQKLIKRAEMEYAIQETNKVLEKR